MTPGDLPPGPDVVTDAPSAEFRFYIDGKLAGRDRVGSGRSEVSLIAASHAALADDCETYGRKWMVEVVFSDGEHVRWGTDVDGMVVPVEVGLGELLQAVARRMAR